MSVEFKIVAMDNDTCIDFLEAIRWRGNPICPYCKSQNSTNSKTDRRKHCNNCNTSYSVTVGTIFHRTRLPLWKWFAAIAVLLTSIRQPVVRELASRIEVNSKTANRLINKLHQEIHYQRPFLLSIAKKYVQIHDQY